MIRHAGVRVAHEKHLILCATKVRASEGVWAVMCRCMCVTVQSSGYHPSSLGCDRVSSHGHLADSDVMVSAPTHHLLTEHTIVAIAGCKALRVVGSVR